MIIQDFPTSYDEIEKFEDLSEECVYVYKIDEESEAIVAEKPGKAQYLLNDCIHLLRIEDEEQSHYVYIKHIDRLVNLHHQLIDKDKRFCPICEKGVKLNEYTRHVSQCYASPRTPPCCACHLKDPK